MSKTTRWILISAITVVVLLVVLSKTGVFGEKEHTRVTAEKAARRTLIEVVNASGKVYPVVEVKVSPDISGEITELTVQEGDTVKKGQLLARIYADIYSLQRDQASFGVNQSQAQLANTEASLDALKAQLDQARKNFDMQKQLFEDKVISRSEFNVAESAWLTAKANYDAGVQSIRGLKANLQSARANLDRASKDLGRTTLLAPMEGVVSLLNVKKGEKVAGNAFNVGTEILRIADMDQIEVRVDVGENDIPKVKLGDSALVVIDAYNERKFRGVVSQIASSNIGASASNALSAASTDVTQYKVHIRLMAESYRDLLGKGRFPFRPGMSATADIQTQTRTDVLSVPINAVTTREPAETGRSSTSDRPDPEEPDVVVFLRGADQRVRKVKVRTGIQDINYIEITEGLKEGDEVVTGPYDVVSKTLTDSLMVNVVDKKELYETKK